MAGDLGVVHLTDLHCGLSSAPEWQEAILLALRGIKADNTLNVRGIAVTGDLADSPGPDGMARAQVVIDRAADALGLGHTTQAQRERIWLVDGNHDYRPHGFLAGRNSEGIEAGKHLKRLNVFADPEVGLLVAGLDSSGAGRLARGYVTQQDLMRLEAEVLAKTALGSYRYRIALVHHHLLQLPSEPRETRGLLARARGWLFDEGFKLLDNAAVVAQRLLALGFDLVLHGHEHQPFAAKISRLEYGADRAMAVLGGIEASRGFQVLRFRLNGEVQVERYERAQGRYEPDRPLTIWSAEDWRRLEWGRESSNQGWYERLELRKDLDASGDLAQRHKLVGLHGSRNTPLLEIPFNLSTQENFGICKVHSIGALDGRSPWKDPLPEPAAQIDLGIPLEPSASADRPHPGLVVHSTVYNGFALTSQDAALRGHSAVESTYISVRRPARWLKLIMRFPSGCIPEDTPELIVYRVISDQKLKADLGETARAADRLAYDQKFGILIFDCDWVMPEYRYVIEWKLPNVPSGREKDGILARETVRALFDLHAARRFTLDTSLRQIKFDVCTQALDCKPHEADQVEMSLSAFNPIESVTRMISGTYTETAAQRLAAFPWGVGVQGLAMRRRRPAFVDTAEPGAAGIYRSLEGCPRDRFVLCVPIGLPLGRADVGELLADPSLPCLIVSFASSSQSGNLERLKDTDLCSAVSSQLSEGVVRMLLSADL
jgi:Calcineurin-like phosphoesterase